MTQETELGTHYGVSFMVAAWSPADARVDLSIACMFEKEAGGAALAGGLLKLDHELKGVITAARREKRFTATELDSLFLTSEHTEESPALVMVVGLGDPSRFTAALMRRVTRFALQQAVRLRVSSVAFAPSLLDSGIKVTPQDKIEQEMTHGVLQALRDEDQLQQASLSPALALKHWYFDVGIEHFAQASVRYLQCFEAEVDNQTDA